MVNEDENKPLKKPVPLPRKSLLQTRISPYKEGISDEGESISSQKKTDGRSFIRDDWKSASGSFVFEKSKQMKNEVQKSVKNIIARRRSIQVKNPAQYSAALHTRCESLPDDNVFLNISFNSPLKDDDKGDNQFMSCAEDCNIYENDMSLPSYLPPDLPDELVNVKMRNCSLTDHLSCKSNSSDAASTYDEVSVSQGLWSSLENNSRTSSIIAETSEKESLSDCDRYEEVNENLFKNTFDCFKLNDIPERDILYPESFKDVNPKKSDSRLSHINYIIHLFDPLQDKSDDKYEEGSSSVKSTEIHNNLSVSADSINKQLLSANIEKASSFRYEIFPVSSKVATLNSSDGQYGKIRKVKSPSKDYVKLTQTEILPPPIPPRKIDSNIKMKVESNSDIEKYENIPIDSKTKANDVLQWSSLKKVAKKVADNIENRGSYISLPGKKKVEENEEGKISTSNLYDLPQSFPKHSGVLYRAGGVQRWGVLSQRKLTMFANKDSPDVKETVPMDGVLSISVTYNKLSVESLGVYCFEISISTRNQPILFGVPSISERHIWMRKLLESINPAFPTKLSMDYTKAGWCYTKESINCPWNKLCIILHHRTLYLYSEIHSFITADLRKARHITVQTEGFSCEKVTEKGPPMLIDLQNKTLYMQMDYERETRAWETAICEAALKNGPTLDEQQLTKDDVPAIVDKCLNFVHTHGTFSEGIYRRNGSNRTVSQLLASFRCNAWAVQLNKNDYTEFDVSSVLKRYFRDLPEPLLVTETHEDLGATLDLKDTKEKIEKYKVALKKLPKINYLTARRLMSHLYFISKQKQKNLMGADNLAAIWGPTLMQVQERVSLSPNCFKIEAYVVNDLIAFYPEIFDLEKSEVEREMKILEMLEIYHCNSNALNKKPSGELKIWVYLHSPKNMDGCFNVSINPQKTAGAICKELSHKTNDPVHSLCLEEVICNGHLSRPLNHLEKVLDTVLRWSYWDEGDRKDNCLVLTKNNLFQQVACHSNYPVIFCEELKFADQKSRSFKTCQFEFSQAKLVCYKDKSCSQKIGEWKVEDIIWYLGVEPKRNPHARWSITFIEKQLIGSRTKERPYFGNTICGTSEEQKFKLISAMLMAQYAKDILPTLNFME